MPDTARTYYIRDLIQDGRAVAVPEGGGQVTFVAGPVPGEKIRLNPDGSYRTLTESDQRAAPFCPHWPDCGGCAIQHVIYESLLQVKQNHFNHTFKEFLKDDVTTGSVVASPATRGHRTKFVFAYANGDFGLYRQGSHAIVNLDVCPVAAPAIERSLYALRAFLDRFAFSDKIKGLYVRAGRKDTLSLLALVQTERVPERATVNLDELDDLRLKDLDIEPAAVQENFLRLQAELDAVGISLALSGLNFGEASRDGENLGPLTVLLPEVASRLLEETILDRIFRIRPGAFFQVNPQAFAMTVRDARTLVPDVQDALDLYCGTGAWGLSVLDTKTAYRGSEIDATALDSAAANARRNGFDNAIFEQTDLEAPITLPETELLLLDPPHRGLNRDLIKEILRAAPEKILYLSCHAASLKRDLKPLTDGYTVRFLRAYDYFPWTADYETLALLNRK